MRCDVCRRRRAGAAADAARARGDQGALSLHSAECSVLSPGCRRSAVALGGPGLFLIAFLDSSFLSFPEVVDLLIIWLVTAHKERMLYYALLPTLGRWPAASRSTASGARAARRFCAGASRAARRSGAGLFRRYGLLAVAVPSLLPPPVPFKIVRAAAGVAGVRPFDFLVAVGDRARHPLFRRRRCWRCGTASAAAQFVRDNARPVSLGLVRSLVLVGGVALDLVSTGADTRGSLTTRPKRLYNQSFIQTMTPEISVVIPMRNESPNVAELYRELTTRARGGSAVRTRSSRSTTAARTTRSRSWPRSRRRTRGCG